MKKNERTDIKDTPMSPEQFRAWRRSLGFKQKDAAEALGLKKRMIQYYEKGRRDDKRVIIPKTVRLACYALSTGVADFDGETAAPGGGAPDRREPPSAEPERRPPSGANNTANPLATGDI